MHKYIVPENYVFKRKFFVEVSSKQEAEEYAENHCGLVLGGDIHSTLPSKGVDWNFPCPPDQTVGKAKKTSC